jgi:TatA/E family protein of Tat protein translocase
MLAGPDLLVVLAIALVVFGPKKLPELAKTIGKTLAELKKTTEDIKDSVGINELGRIRSSLTDVDLLTDLAEKVSTSMVLKEGAGSTSKSSKETPPLSAGAPIPPGTEERLEKKDSKNLA